MRTHTLYAKCTVDEHPTWPVDEAIETMSEGRIQVTFHAPSEVLVCPECGEQGQRIIPSVALPDGRAALIKISQESR